MKIIVIMLIMLCGVRAEGQSLHVYDIDTTEFPVMKAKFFAFDKDGKVLTDLKTSDFEITENGEQREVSYKHCPSTFNSQFLSTAIVIDITCAMKGENIELAKKFSETWINKMPNDKSDCAITTFDSKYYYVQDFTNDKNLLIDKINHDIELYGGYEYSTSLTSPLLAGILTLKAAKYKKILILITNGNKFTESNSDEVINMAIENDIAVYPIIISNECPQSFKDIALKTGGKWFEKVKSVEQIKGVAYYIQQLANGAESCRIEWLSKVFCKRGTVNIDIKLIKNGAMANIQITAPESKVALFQFEPSTIHFKNKQIGFKNDTTITLTAINRDFEISNIQCSDNRFKINPGNFFLKAGESKELTISYTPTDSNYYFSEFEFNNQYCPVKFYASGGFTGWKANSNTLKITNPRNNETLVQGSDTLISWQGVPESDRVILEYSTDKGRTWIELTDTATGLQYLWKNIPKPTSDNCLIKVKQLNPSNRRKDDLLWSTFSANGNSVAWSPDGDKIALSASKEVIIIDAKSGFVLDLLTCNTGSEFLDEVCWSHNRNRIIASSSSSTYIWDLNKKEIVRYWNWGKLKSSALSPDGNYLAASSYENKIFIIDVNTGKHIYNLIGHNADVISLCWNPNGNMLVSGSDDYTIKIWDINTGQLINTLLNHHNYVSCLSWSPDGSRIASGSWDNSIKIWDSENGKLIQDIRNNKSTILSISWSPDSKKLASSSWDKKIKIWNTETGMLIDSIGDSDETFLCQLWNPISNKIVSGSLKGIKIWDLENKTFLT